MKLLPCLILLALLCQPVPQSDYRVPSESVEHEMLGHLQEPVDPNAVTDYCNVFNSNPCN